MIPRIFRRCSRIRQLRRECSRLEQVWGELDIDDLEGENKVLRRLLRVSKLYQAYLRQDAT
jgi:hypothetical protein